jgi:hypothetical protein
LLAIAAMLMVTPKLAFAADLKRETVKAWNEYINVAAARNQERLQPGKAFLVSDETPSRIDSLRSGRMLVSPIGAHVPVQVPFGLIHDWMGAVFLPNATIQQVLAVTRDYSHYKDFYQTNVVESKAIMQRESTDWFSMVITNKSLAGKTVLDTSYESTYARLDDDRWYSITEMTSVREVANYGTPAQRALPENKGSGYIWRLYNVTRLQQRDGGVYIELEVIALSRDIPHTVRWFVEPIVKRVSRSSLEVSLKETDEAVRSGAAWALASSKSELDHEPSAASLHRSDR